jgi:3-hydroxybutyryl-CoA dehydrogenase
MQIQTVGVAGLGLLGRGIAACFLAHGFHVIGYTRRQVTHEEARRQIQTAIEDLIARAGYSETTRTQWPAHYLEVNSVTEFGACDFVIESVVEDLAVKQEIFDQIESVVRFDVPIASNTSALPITILQTGRRHPERFLGMHWAEPAHATRFLELIRGERTADASFEAAAGLASRIGKEPSLVQKDVPAFIVNRMAYAMYREALNILEMNIADIETIDRSFRNACGLWATMCGPFRWIDLTGGPVLYGKVLEGVLPSLCNSTELPETLKALMKMDARGIVNGHGFYRYTEDESRHWEDLFREHAWTVRELMNNYFPLEVEERETCKAENKVQSKGDA